MNKTKPANKLISSEIIKEIDNLNDQAWQVHVTQPNLGLELSVKAKNLSEKHAYKKGLAYAIRNMGVSHRYLSKLEKALSLSNEALELFNELEDKSGASQALVTIGAIYYYMGDYEKAIYYFLDGLKEGEEIGNKESMAYAYNGAGYVYSVTGDNKKGLSFLQKGLKLSRAIANFTLESSTLESIATHYLNDNQIDKAYSAFIDCKNLSEEKNDKRNLAEALFGIGNVLLRKNKPKDAKNYFFESLIIYREFGYKIGEADSLLALGMIANKLGSEEAEGLLQESLKVAEEIKANASIYKSHQELAEFYEKRDTQLFVKHYKLYHKFKSEVYREEQELKSKFLTIQYEMEKLQKEAEITRLTNVVMKEKNEELEKKKLELEKSYDNISVLSKIGRDITSTLDLETILNTVYENVNELMDATIFGIGIYNEEEESIAYRLSVEEGKRYQPYTRKMSDKSQLAVWCIENNKEVFINDIDKEFIEYLKDIDLTVLSSAALEDGSMPKNPKSLIYLPLQVKDKIIGLISIQSFKKNRYKKYHLEILKTLASYTSAALYNAQSYETLQGALNVLKLTQAQLIQSEKMASLGELTAGIAHEIQNPLNFVNNFSEVSGELVDEMEEEIEEGNLKDVKEIATDLKQNLEKINHHGQRASSIVKGMLEHSRAGDGTKELTDINKLADEYLRLSYHGLRAKDKSFNADFKTHFDESLPKINIVSQDIGRVLLNLINNAFYAVSEKAKHSKQDYKPTVAVSTNSLKDKIEIRVHDNGDGIPKKVIDKIFQPFFTTKPTGQGTGLGLSMSYDIVTKGHGGKLKVESKEGKGSEFIIILPIV